MISEPLLEELKVVLEEDYGMEVSKNELLEIATSLTSLFELLGTMDKKKGLIQNNG